MTQVLKLSLLRSAINLLEEKEKELVFLKNGEVEQHKRKASNSLKEPQAKKLKRDTEAENRILGMNFTFAMICASN
jgi:hypothetical protein